MAMKEINSFLYFGPLWRCYIYAIHGYFVEVTYTALWELLVNQDLRCPGNSHLWALFIYGFSTYVIERWSPYLRDTLGLPLVIRGIIYTIWTFFWEFSTGYALKHFGACPWNYEPWFDYHVMGLITLEYIPLWFTASLTAENVLIFYTQRLCIGPPPTETSKKTQ